MTDVTATTPTDDRPLDTLTGLLLACRDNPEEDTPRLLLADYHDENGEPERAELIRMQAEIGKGPPACHCFMYGCDESFGDSEEVGCFKDWNKAIRRERELTAALGERLSAPCPTCGAEGGWSGGPTCPTCEGSGDLLRVTMRADGARPHRWLRGCLYLDVTLGEVAVDVRVDCPECHGGDIRPTRETNWLPCEVCKGANCVREWRPTPWAAALPAEAVGLWATDREPYDLSVQSSLPEMPWVWDFQGDERVPNNRHCLPSFLRPFLSGATTHPDVFHYPTPYLARLHLAHALRRWVYENTPKGKT